MMQIFSKITCIMFTWAMTVKDEEYIEEKTLNEIFNQCGIDYKMGVRLLTNLGILSPYRPGIYRIQKLS